MYPEVLAAGAALGDRFVAYVAEPGGPGWLPATALFGAGLPGALAAVGRSRGTTSHAVAGALLFEQYAQRLVAPALAALYRDGTEVDAGLPGVRAELVGGAVRRLAFARTPAAARADRGAARAWVLERLLTGNLDAAADSVHRHARVGRRVLRGAVANAIASTMLHMSWPDDDHARYVGEAQALLDRWPGLADLVTVAAVPSGGERWMYTRRNACCLAFRTTVNQARDQPYCSACPVLPVETTRALFARATAAYAAGHPRA